MKRLILLSCLVLAISCRQVATEDASSKFVSGDTSVAYSLLSKINNSNYLSVCISGPSAQKASAQSVFQSLASVRRVSSALPTVINEWMSALSSATDGTEYQWPYSSIQTGINSTNGVCRSEGDVKVFVYEDENEFVDYCKQYVSNASLSSCYYITNVRTQTIRIRASVLTPEYTKQILRSEVGTLLGLVNTNYVRGFTHPSAMMANNSNSITQDDATGLAAVWKAIRQNRKIECPTGYTQKSSDYTEKWGMTLCLPSDSTNDSASDKKLNAPAVEAEVFPCQSGLRYTYSSSDDIKPLSINSSQKTIPSCTAVQVGCYKNGIIQRKNINGTDYVVIREIGGIEQSEIWIPSKYLKNTEAGEAPAICR